LGISPARGEAHGGEAEMRQGSSDLMISTLWLRELNRINENELKIGLCLHDTPDKVAT
jgi:hypothetical protein